MSRITEVDVIPFTFEVPDLELGGHRAMGVSNVQYKKGSGLTVMRYAIAIRTDDGCQGRYVTHWVGTQSALGQTVMIAPHLLGRDPEQRELIKDGYMPVPSGPGLGVDYDWDYIERNKIAEHRFKL